MPFTVLHPALLWGHDLRRDVGWRSGRPLRLGLCCASPAGGPRGVSGCWFPALRCVRFLALRTRRLGAFVGPRVLSLPVFLPVCRFSFKLCLMCP